MKVSELDLPEPLEYHYTYDLYDSSKLQTFLDCPRRYFYEYILAWRQDRPNKHLIFGESWHRALEVILREGKSAEAIEHAFKAFMGYYREHFSANTDSDMFPKNPASALNALIDYTHKYQDEKLRVMQIGDKLMLEIAGTVPLDMGSAEQEALELHFRLDSIVLDSSKKQIYCLEHKTASRNSQAWHDGWHLKTQISVYSHALFSLNHIFKTLYPDYHIFGIVVNGTFFTKTALDSIKGESRMHVRVPVRKTREDMRVFQWNIKEWISFLQGEWQSLTKCSPDDDVLRAFPMNTNACTNFGGCPYFDICMSWANPLKHAASPPSDIVTEYWDPGKRSEAAKVKVNKGEVEG